MFSKKPTSPKAPWAVRLLTPDFMVDGYTNTEAHPETEMFFVPHGSSVPATMLWLDSPHFTAVTAGAALPPAIGQWLLPYSGNHVAVLPFDTASLAAVRKSAESFKYPFKTVLSVGPYLIRGQLMSDYEGVSYMSLMAGRSSVVVQDAEIECRLPQTTLAAFKAPMVLVRTQLLQGIGLLS